MTRKSLEEHTCKELAEMAKKKRLTGWHAMRKDELIDALLAAQRRRRYRTRKQANSRQSASSTRNKSGKRTASPGKKRGKSNGKARTAKQSASRKRTSSKTSRKKRTRHGNGAPNRRRRTALTAAGYRDRLSARACDAYWLYASWQVTGQMLERARAALGTGWHQAVPMLRVFDVTPGEAASGSAAHLRDIRIHGQINYWYVPVERPSRSYQLEIGYRAPDGQFFALARSNKVRTPRPGARSPRADRETATAEGSQPGFDQSVNRGRAGTGLPKLRRSSRDGNGNGTDFEFSLDAELVVYGTTHPDTELTLFGEQVSVDKNGMFTQRFNLPEGRQVFPAVAVTPDGSEQRTIVLSVERNVRELEPQPLDEPDV